jgi:hypothetical protein
MTRRRRARRCPQEIPPAVLTPFAVLNAPELAALVLLEHAIDVAWVAVLAQHLELIDPDAPFLCAPHQDADLTALFFTRAHALSVAVRRYRAAVAAAAEQRQSLGGRASSDDDI